MTDTICIYHGNCADGFGAAWAVRHALGNNIDFYPGMYQQEPPNVSGKHVIMVDFSYKKDVIAKMSEEALTVLILDHHKSAAADLDGILTPPSNTYLPETWLNESKAHNMHAPLYAIFDMERSGAIIAWDFFHPFDARPRLLSHIEDRDLWRFKMEGTREIQAALFSYPYDFNVWDDLMKTNTSSLFRQGEAIERKHFKDINEFIGIAARRMDIAGHNIPCLNAPYFYSSDAGHIMAKGEKFSACYWDTPEGRVFSLRSNDQGLDVSEIAVIYGGGGHRNAAGFSIPHDHGLCNPMNFTK